MPDADYIAGLLRELKHHETYGNEDEAAEVKAELKRVGHEAKAPAKRAATRERKGGKSHE